MTLKRGFLVASLLLLLSPAVVLPQQADVDATVKAAAGIDPSQLSACALRALASSTSTPLGSPLIAFARVEARRQAACQGNTCPEPKSCGSWSSWYNCDAPFCGEDSLCSAKGTNATLQTQERFRACTLSGGGQCIEYEHQSIRLHCGCQEGAAAAATDLLQ